jgi:D-alanine transaminase
VVLRFAQEHRLRLVERAFSVEEAKRAVEAFLTSTTSWIKPVVEIDQVVIGAGVVGPLTDRLRSLYVKHIEQIEGTK